MRYPNGKAAKFMWVDGDKVRKVYSEEEERYRTARNSNSKAMFVED